MRINVSTFERFHPLLGVHFARCVTDGAADTSPLVSVALHRSFDDLTGRLHCRQQIRIEYSELAVCVVSTRFPLKPVPFLFFVSFVFPLKRPTCVCFALRAPQWSFRCLHRKFADENFGGS